MGVETKQMKRRYWIGVVSRDHVLKGVHGGFTQLCHGKEGPLKRMGTGDWIIYYSSKKNFKENTPYQKFTAIGKIIDNHIYQCDMGNGFIPFRRNIDFLRSKEIPIHPLIPYLSFIVNKKHWGYAFRFGHLEISEQDFHLIAKQMVIKGE